MNSELSYRPGAAGWKIPLNKGMSMTKVLGNGQKDCSPEQMTEDELWVDYRQNKDPKIRETFVKQYAPLVKYVAGKVVVGMPHNVEFDDLVGFGVFGLLDAIDKFDPEKGVKFKTYAVTRIRGAIFDELRSIDWVPRSVRQKTREVEEAIGSLEAQLGRTATDQEIASSLGMNEDEFTKTMMKISTTSILSLNDVWFSGDDNDKVTIEASIESPSSLNPDIIVEKEEVRRVIISAINELPDKEKKILVLYYYEDLTLKEIGQVLEVTESRVSQLHTKAMLRLRGKLTNIRKGII
jgi:RNA polymerase sigma factor for flagellar operon FliA